MGHEVAIGLSWGWPRVWPPNVAFTLPTTNITLKKVHPKMKIHLSTIAFQGRTVSFREGISPAISCIYTSTWLRMASTRRTIATATGVAMTWATEKTRPYFALYWLFSRDPYNGLLYSLHNWVVESPIYPRQRVFFHCSHDCLSLAQFYSTWGTRESGNRLLRMKIGDTMSRHTAAIVIDVA